VALLLKQKGIERVRPLEGGLDAWREHGYPIVSAEEVDAPARLSPAAK
jgi:rhodanese-related sulfurtransferase